MRSYLVCVLAVLGATTARADSVLDSALQLTEVETLPVTEAISDFRFLPDGRIVVATREGSVFLVDPSNGTSELAGTLEVDTAGENGLLAVEVHPDFATNRTLFFFRSRTNANGGSVDDRHEVISIALADDDTLDPDTEVRLVGGIRGDLEQLSGAPNNPGGVLAIDARTTQRFLYIGVGDTGCVAGANPSFPQTFYASCRTNPNGKILRVNLDGSIPSTNPLVAVDQVESCGTTCDQFPSSGAPGEPRDEIWVWGFREPSGLTLDPVTGRLWAIDSGEDLFEEINQVPSGNKHFGWPFRAGGEGSMATESCGFQTTPSSEECVEPEYACAPNASGTIEGGCRAAVGGAFLDSCTFPLALRGGFLFADRLNGAVYRLALTAGRDGISEVNARTQLATITDGRPTRLRTGPDGNIYLATTTGTLRRLSPVVPEPCDGDGGTGGDNPGGGPGGPPVGGGDPLPDGRCGCGAAPGSGLAALLAWALTRRRR